MDKKGKKTLRYPVSKVYASQAATMNLAATKPPMVSTPNGPKATKKEPIIIDLTADSESKGTARRRSSERKVNKAFWYRLELGNPLKLGHLTSALWIVALITPKAPVKAKQIL
ncbi:hypothetical protein PIB30_077753 [Stylosanthes scabra]|uniref:Uncharacterized protein n=1 Tax=Stylosanthes scabra TaxID=79078 RepID=A0ABU6XR50_9FABA|nr:hypothetical protein [Stylosanthes scabra]